MVAKKIKGAKGKGTAILGLRFFIISDLRKLIKLDPLLNMFDTTIPIITHFKNNILLIKERKT